MADSGMALADYITLDEAALTLARMRMRKTVRERALGALRRVLELKGMRFLGRPSSYFGYLMKVRRPRQGRRRVVARLPYSEM